MTGSERQDLLREYVEADELDNETLGPSASLSAEPLAFVDFRKAGERKYCAAFPYSDLRFVEHQATDASTLLLRFSGHDVVLRGERLLALYEHLLKQTVAVVREVKDPRVLSTMENRPVIRSIEIGACD